MKAIITVAVVLLSMCGCSLGYAATQDKKYELRIPKKFRDHADPEHYRATITLPVGSDGVSLEMPKDSEEASVLLRKGLDDEIMRESASALLSACRVLGECNPGSRALWDEFYANLEEVQLSDINGGEIRHRISNYLSAAYREVGRTWFRDDACRKAETVCAELTASVKASYEIYGEILFRKSFMDEIGKPTSVCEVASSMGDVVVLTGKCESRE